MQTYNLQRVERANPSQATNSATAALSNSVHEDYLSHHSTGSNNNISVINYNNPQITIKQEFASPFPNLEGTIAEVLRANGNGNVQPPESSATSSLNQGAKMLRKSYEEESDF